MSLQIESEFQHFATDRTRAVVKMYSCLVLVEIEGSVKGQRAEIARKFLLLYCVCTPSGACNFVFLSQVSLQTGEIPPYFATDLTNECGQQVSMYSSLVLGEKEGSVKEGITMVAGKFLPMDIPSEILIFSAVFNFVLSLQVIFQFATILTPFLTDMTSVCERMCSSHVLDEMGVGDVGEGAIITGIFSFNFSRVLTLWQFAFLGL